MKNSILLIGKKGMLGSMLYESLVNSNFNVIGLGSSELDITDYEKVRSVIKDTQPSMIINTAAYTNVNEAENNGKSINYKVNHIGVKNLVDAANLTDAIFFHISTDYVFGQNSKSGYKEDEVPINPINEYGKAKRLGEMEAEHCKNKFFICRTSWLFGPNRANFVTKIFELSNAKDEIQVVSDEYGVPTYTKDVSDMITYMIRNVEKLTSGYYHLVNDGTCSRFDEASEIIKFAGLKTKILEKKLEDFDRKAKVANYSILLNTKLPKLRDWKSALQEYMNDYLLYR